MMTAYTAFVDISQYSKAWALWKLYDYVRLSLIGISFIVILQLYHAMLQTSRKGDRKRHPLYHLLCKITPYSIILSLSRFGATSYKWIYQGSLEEFPNDATGMHIFWLYVSIILMPFGGVGCLVAFVNVTTGAQRSLIQMLHLECIFNLPAPPTEWAEEHGNNHCEFSEESETPRHSQQQNREMRQSTRREEHDRLADMDEHDLANAMLHFKKELTARSMSENEVRTGDSITNL